MKIPHIIIFVFVITGLVFSFTSCKKGSDDNTAPEITIIGANPIYTQLDSSYIDPGATAMDDIDGDISDEISTVMDVNVNVPGYNYYVYYNVSDDAGNKANEKKRRVIVQSF